MNRTAPRLNPIKQKTLLGFFILASYLLAAPFLNRSLQADEASSLWFTRLPWSTFLADFCDPHPPGYYLLLKGWLTLITSPLWARLLSLWAGVLSIPLTFHLGKRWNGTKTGLLAAGLLALHPLTAWYAAQTRMYALVQLLGLVTLLSGTALLNQWGKGGQRGNWKWGMFYWTAASLLLWADYTGWLVWAVLQLGWMAMGRPHKRRWISWQTAVILPYLTLLSFLPATRSLASGYQPVFVAVQAWNLGFFLPPDKAANLMLALMLAVIVLGIIAAFWGPRWGEKRPAFFTWGLRLLLIGGWFLLLALTAVPRLYTVKRLLVPLLPAMALATAVFAQKSRRRLAIWLLPPGFLISLLLLPGHAGESWQQAVADLTQNAPEGAIFWVDEMVVPVFSYYAEPEMAGRWAPLDGRLPPQLPALQPANDVSSSDAPLFLVTSSSPYRSLTALLPQTFAQDYVLQEKMMWPGVMAYQFSADEEGGAWWEGERPSYPAEWGLLLPSPLDSCR